MRQYAIRRPVENTYLVRQRDRRLMRELVSMLLAVALVGGGLLAYTWVHVEILRTGYRVNELERNLQSLRKVEQRHRLAVSRLTSPERIEERAVRELGMRPPVLEQTLFLGEVVP